MEPSKEVKREITSTEGMEHLFEEVPLSTLAQEEEQFLTKEPEEVELYSSDVEAVELVPVRYAAKQFGKTRRYISKLANEGRIKAEKNDKNQWMVELESVKNFFDGEDQTKRTVPDPENKRNSSVRSLLDQERIRELEQKNKDLEQEVRNSHFRLGYFESERTNYQERLKLLEDKEAKAQKDRKLLDDVQRQYALLEDEKYGLEEKYQEMKDQLDRYEELKKRSAWKKFSDWMLGR